MRGGNYGSSYSPSYQLGGSYYRLHANGSLEGPITSIALRDPEGVVLLNAGPSVNVDVNSDGAVNVKDLSIVIFNQGRTPTGNYAHLDLNSDSSINWNDVQIVMSNI